MLENPTYHFILGHEFFSHMAGVVDIGGHAVEFTTLAGLWRLSTVPYSMTCTSPVYTTAQEQLATASRAAPQKLPSIA